MMNENEWHTYLSLADSGPIASVQIRPKLPLPPWDEGVVRDEDLLSKNSLVPSLRSILNLRHSSRQLWNPLSLDEIHKILSLTLSRPSQKLTSRPYPTSGGCDELGILIVSRKVEGLPEGAYWATTDTQGNFIYAASLNDAFAEFEHYTCLCLGLSPENPPAASLLILSDWQRLSQRYKNCILASALWDCGALLQTLSLASAAVEVNACICACIKPLLVGKWLGLDCRQIGHIGTFALGGRSY